MPVNKSLAKSLKKKYGAKKGESVYFGMENAGKPAFKKGMKTATKEGHTAAHMKDLKKKPAAKKVAPKKKPKKAA